MFTYIEGEVVLIERRVMNPAVTLTVAANGIGIPAKVFRVPPGLIVGQPLRLYLLQTYSQQNGYSFYGFYDIESWGIASRLCALVDGVGPSGITAVVHSISHEDLRRIGLGQTSKFGVKGLGPKKEEIIRKALMEIFKVSSPSGDELGDRLQESMDSARKVLEDFGVQVTEALFTQFALEIPTENLTGGKLVEKYLEHIRKG